MGPGTGLGQANLYWSENFGGYRVWPSEGAHASFAPRGWKQRALQTHVERQLGYCEVEHVSQPACMKLAWEDFASAGRAIVIAQTDYAKPSETWSLHDRTL